jgi:hypothetical protein
LISIRETSKNTKPEETTKQISETGLRKNRKKIISHTELETINHIKNVKILKGENIT